MRRLVLVALLAAALAQSAAAAAATVDPSRLVLRQSDVPSTFTLNERESGLRTLGKDSAGFPALKAKYRSWGHLTGYQIRFDRGEHSIVSRADILRGRAGAHGMYGWFAGQLRRQGVKGTRISALALGDEAVALSVGGGGLSLTVVAWRQGRVFSVVGGAGLTKARVLALARRQQQRVASALS